MTDESTKPPIPPPQWLIDKLLRREIVSIEIDDEFDRNALERLAARLTEWRLN
jgi:hypothetical protein